MKKIIPFLFTLFLFGCSNELKKEHEQLFAEKVSLIKKSSEQKKNVKDLDKEIERIESERGDLTDKELLMFIKKDDSLFKERKVFSANCIAFNKKLDIHQKKHGCE